MLATFSSTLAVATAPESLDAWDLVLNSRGVVLGVVVILILFSVSCWFIIGFKLFHIKTARTKTDQFLDVFWTSKRLDEIYQAAQRLKRSPISQVFRAGYVELSKIKSSGEGDHQAWLGDMQSIERALVRAKSSELTHLEAMLPFLATTGSAAPFVGLFGTVWGIMNSFREIGVQGSASLTTVAPGIAEALVATAIGLVAAIPAVVAYNFFVSRVRVLAVEMDGFANDFLNIVKRHFFK